MCNNGRRKVSLRFWGPRSKWGSDSCGKSLIVTMYLLPVHWDMFSCLSSIKNNTHKLDSSRTWKLNICTSNDGMVWLWLRIRFCVFIIICYRYPQGQGLVCTGYARSLSQACQNLLKILLSPWAVHRLQWTQTQLGVWYNDIMRRIAKGHLMLAWMNKKHEDSLGIQWKNKRMFIVSWSYISDKSFLCYINLTNSSYLDISKLAAMATEKLSDPTICIT